MGKRKKIAIGIAAGALAIALAIFLVLYFRMKANENLYTKELSSRYGGIWAEKSEDGTAVMVGANYSTQGPKVYKTQYAAFARNELEYTNTRKPPDGELISQEIKIELKNFFVDVYDVDNMEEPYRVLDIKEILYTQVEGYTEYMRDENPAGKYTLYAGYFDFAEYQGKPYICVWLRYVVGPTDILKEARKICVLVSVEDESVIVDYDGTIEPQIIRAQRNRVMDATNFRQEKKSLYLSSYNVGETGYFLDYFNIEKTPVKSFNCPLAEKLRGIKNIDYVEVESEQRMPNIVISLTEINSFEELAEMIVPYGTDPSLKGVTLKADYSIDGQEHLLESYEDFEKYYNGA